MKQKILLCCMCVSLFFSCAKDHKDTNSPKLYPINFKVADFIQTTVPLGKAKTTSLTTVADTAPIQSLVYMLFSPTALVSTKRVEKGATDFGTFTDNVPAGKYTVVFCGGASNLKVTSGSYFSYVPTILANVPVYWGDTFYKRVPITITADGANQSVSMDRVTSKLVLVIKDAIPTGTTRLTVSFKDTASIRAVTGVRTTLTTNGADKTITAADIGTTNYTITMNTLNNVKPFDVTINYYGANASGPIGSKIVKNVVCNINTKTTLSGYVFTPSNSEFGITVNQDWNSPVTINF